MKATVDPDSAEGRAEIDRLQHQILQIYQSLRGRLASIPSSLEEQVMSIPVMLGE